jgi:hypothetical protein
MPQSPLPAGRRPLSPAEALLWAGLFVVAYRQVGILGRRAVLSGLLYGLLIWLILNLAVLPLTHEPRVPFSLKQTPLSILYVVFVAGLTISLVVNRLLGPAGLRRRAF